MQLPGMSVVLCSAQNECCAAQGLGYHQSMSEKPRRRRLTPPPAGEQSGPRTRLIRKYGNRRLYDTHTSRYVTLEALVEVFSGDDEVQVVDAVSGEDLTKKVLAQAILFEEERRHTQIIPLDLLRALLRHREQASGEVYQRRVARAVSDLVRLHRPNVAIRPDTDRKADELDELRRRLKALERQIQRR